MFVKTLHTDGVLGWSAWCCHWIPGAQSSWLLGRQQLPYACYHLAVWRRASATLSIVLLLRAHTPHPSEKLFSKLRPRSLRLRVCVFFFISTLLSVPLPLKLGKPPRLFPTRATYCIPARENAELDIDVYRVTADQRGSLLWKGRMRTGRVWARKLTSSPGGCA